MSGDRAKAIAVEMDVPCEVAAALCDFIRTVVSDAMDDGAGSADEAVASSMSSDDYYDFLEGHCIGHRRLRRWINEKRVGESVRLTKEGRRVAMCITRSAAALAKGDGE